MIKFLKRVLKPSITKEIETPKEQTLAEKLQDSFNELPSNGKVKGIIPERRYKGFSLPPKTNERVKVKKVKETLPVLVLWDLENVNFANDAKELNKILPKDSLRIAVMQKNENYHKIFSRLSKEKNIAVLKRRGWVIHKISKNKIADEVLFDHYKKHKNKITDLYVITTDSDFKDICTDAKSIGINVTVLSNKQQPKWTKAHNFISIRKN